MQNLSGVMPQAHGSETFFTVIGCMDGRCVSAVDEFGRNRFGAEYADTITEPGIVAMLSNNPSQDFLSDLKSKILISINIHKSKGIIIDGHAECAGDPVPDEVQKDEIRKSVDIIKSLIGISVPVVGVFVKRNENGWQIEEITTTVLA